MDSSKQYYGIYLDTRGAPVQLEVMPGYEKKLIEHNIGGTIFFKKKSWKELYIKWYIFEKEYCCTQPFIYFKYMNCIFKN